MTQSIDIAIIRDRALQRIGELHDDYSWTDRLWQEQLTHERYGSASTIHNLKTGSAIAGQAAWSDQARTSRRRLRNRTFKDLANEVELFIGALLRDWLFTFPWHIEQRSITLGTILSSNDLAAVRSLAIKEAVDSAILDKLKGKPIGWFNYLKEHLNVQISQQNREIFIERKAARDALEHHDGVIDLSYRDKAGVAVRYAVGDLFEPDDISIDELYDVVVRIVSEISSAALLELNRLNTGGN